MRTLVTRLVKNHLTFETGAICFLFLFIEVNTQSLEDFSNKLSIRNISGALAKTAELGLDRSADAAGRTDKGLLGQEEARRRSNRGSHLGAFCSTLKSALQKEEYCPG